MFNLTKYFSKAKSPLKKARVQRKPRYSIQPVTGLTGQKKSVQFKKNKKQARRAKNRGYKVIRTSPYDPNQRYSQPGQRYTRGNL